MTDGQSFFCELNGPFPDDMPFGLEGERRRRELEDSAKDRRSVVAEIRDEMRRITQRAIQRREGRYNVNETQGAANDVR